MARERSATEPFAGDRASIGPPMFSKDVLNIDAHAVASSIEETIRQQVMGTLRRRGAVVGTLGRDRQLGRGDALRPGARQGARARHLHAGARLVGRCPAARPAALDPSRHRRRRRGHRARAARRSAATSARTRPSGRSSPSTARGGSARSPCRPSSTAIGSTSSQLTVADPGGRASGPRACRRPPTCRSSPPRTSSSASAR